MRINRFIRHFKDFLRSCWWEGIDSDEYIRYLRKQGVRIGENVHFRRPSHTIVDTTRPCLVEFGNNVDINENFCVLTHDFGTFVFREVYKDFVNSSGKVKIGDNIVFGRNVTILKSVEIGDNCIIGAGAIVSKSIPSNSVAVGSPAKVICTLDDYYKKRKALQVEEAIEYASKLAVIKGGIDQLRPSDFSEEWVLFLSEHEYDSNATVRNHVDFRLKGKVDIHEFLNRQRQFVNFDAFIEEVNKGFVKKQNDEQEQ